MKKIFLLLTASVIHCQLLTAQNVGIGTTTPNSSAMLEVKATNKGILIPQVALQSLTDVSTVPAPATSLLVYNTNATLGAGYYYNAGTTTAANWAKLITTATTLNGWSTAGNSGTTAANFIGTTDAQPLVFKMNNIKSGLIDSAHSNTSIGYKSLYANSYGFANTANGYGTLSSNTLGSSNTATGSDALYSNIDGISNTAVGERALYSNNTGWYNVALGNDAGADAYGDHNIFIGAYAHCNVGISADNQLNIGNWIYGDNGKIGIGAGSNAQDPTRAQLVIDGSAPYTTPGSYGYLNTVGAGSAGAYTINASIWASNRIVAEEFDATSDARIKRDIEPLPDNSLALLKKINVVSYSKLNKSGYTSEIGILGQELEKILPTAVKQSEGDIYNDSTHQWEVVKDFRTVNYQSLNLLTTKAVQELNEKVAAQQIIINDQTKQLDSQQIIIDAMQKRLDALEKKN